MVSEWFDAGTGVATGHGGRFPPLDDAEAQRWWLGGFGTACGPWAATSGRWRRPWRPPWGAVRHCGSN